MKIESPNHRLENVLAHAAFASLDEQRAERSRAIQLPGDP